jgi:hypothetical protein
MKKRRLGEGRSDAQGHSLNVQDKDSITGLPGFVPWAEDVEDETIQDKSKEPES